MTRGFEVECAHVGAHIVGGDVTASDKIVIAVTAMGDAVRPVLRSGALPATWWRTPDSSAWPERVSRP